jgi:hypothetical protein
MGEGPRREKIKPNLRMLRVCKQVHGEALQVGWENSTKHFQDTRKFYSIATSPDKPPFNWLSRIELNFDYTDYFAFFGFRFFWEEWQRAELYTPNHGTLLANIPTLKSLWFTLPDPYYACENPWSTYDDECGIIHWSHLSEEERNKQTWCCTRQLTEWLLTLAFPYIKNIPNIHLGGCIKTSVKARWERILKNARYEQDHEARSDGLVLKDTMEEISKLTVMDAPGCTCPLSCIRKRAQAQFELQDIVEWDGDYDHDDVFSPELLERAFRLYWRAPVKGLRIKVVGPDANLLALEAQYPAEEVDAQGTWVDETFPIGLGPVKSSDVVEVEEED